MCYEISSNIERIYNMRKGDKNLHDVEKNVAEFAFASVIALKDIKSGEIFSKENIWVRRPGNGDFSAEDFNSLLGLKSCSNIPKNTQLKLEDVKKIKVFCFTGTRADYPRIRPVLEEINNRKNKFNLGLVVTGQHLLKSRGNSIKLIQADPFNIISKISMFDEKDDSFEGNVKAYANCVKGVTDLVIKNKPDVALISGDRVETLAVATVCRVLGIAICHIQGGEVSGTQDEVFRHSITKLSDVHCVATNLSKVRLLSMGEERKNIFVTGCPYIEYIESKLTPIERITENKEYYIVCLHANTSNYKEKKYIEIFFEILKKNFIEKEIIVLMPNTDPGYNIIK